MKKISRVTNRKSKKTYEIIYTSSVNYESGKHQKIENYDFYKNARKAPTS